MRKDLGSGITDITGTYYDYVRMIPPNGIIALCYPLMMPSY